ncbi:MAG: type IV pilus modification protein PilV [Pseudomonadota bacterium]|nr:type IV pilus modification protein PilV [Pseudomonadota bacterium]
MPLNQTNYTNIGHRLYGFTLLEVMVALVIFSIGLLGLAGLQSQSLRYNHSAYLQTQATFLAYDILDRMRANKETAQAGGYNAGFSTSGTNHDCNNSSVSCGTNQMAQFDIYEWKDLLSDSLPAGTGSVGQSGDVFTVTIQWDDPGTPGDESEIQIQSEL